MEDLYEMTEDLNISAVVCNVSNLSQTNSTINSYKADIDFWGEGVGLLFISTFGIVGNIVSIFVLTSQDIDLKPSFANILICLAGYDLLFGVCAVLMYCMPQLSEQYAAHVLPLVAPYLLGVIHIALTGSIYTTIAVAVERCVTVCAPFTDIRMCRGALYIVPIVIFSVVYNITKFYEVETVPSSYNNQTGYVPPNIMKTEFNSPLYIVTTRITNCIVMGLLPMLILALLNYLIYRAVSKAHAHHNSITQGHAHRRDSTMAALLTGIVLVFMICHSVKAAINIYEAKQVLELFPCEMQWTPLTELFTILSHILIALNSSMNILIYVFKDFKFRQVLLQFVFGKEESRIVSRRGLPSVTFNTTRGVQASQFPMTHLSTAGEITVAHTSDNHIIMSEITKM